MKNQNSLLTISLFTILFLAAFLPSFAQDKTTKPNSTANKKAVIFKVPDTFMQAPMITGQKGLMMLNPKKPAGTFVAYTPDNQKSENFAVELRKMFAEMFINDKEVKLDWKETVLPAHEKVKNETGKMFLTTANDKELQVVAYTRTISEGQDVIYGYFAMRDTKSKENSADFINAQGKGVKEFDSFWKTISVSKK